jgi:hypothetical protein
LLSSGEEAVIQKLTPTLLDVTVPLTRSIHVKLARSIHIEQFHQTPFVFEELQPSYFMLDYSEHQALLLLGPLASQSLAHIQRVYVVFQPNSKTQIMVA